MIVVSEMCACRMFVYQINKVQPDLMTQYYKTGLGVGVGVGAGGVDWNPVPLI